MSTPRGASDRGFDHGPEPAAATVTDADLALVFRREHGRTVAILARILGDLDLAEDAVQEAFAVAMDRWRREGLPPSPAGWLVTTARNGAVDRLRREALRARPQIESQLLHAPDEELLRHLDAGPVRDDRLRLTSETSDNPVEREHLLRRASECRRSTGCR